MLKKIFLICTIAVLSTLMISCDNNTVSPIVNESLNDDALVLTYTDDVIAGFYKSDEIDYEILQNEMTAVIENDFLKLYMGKDYDIAVLDKTSGKIFFSNRQIYDDNEFLTNDQQRDIYSQIFLDYYDQIGRIRRMTSFPDAYDANQKNQVEVEITQNKVNVTYFFGTRVVDKLIPYVMTGETFNFYTERANTLISDGKLSRTDWGRFNAAYNRVVLDNLSDNEKTEVLRRYPNIEEIGEIFVVSPAATYIQLDLIERVSKILEITKEIIDREQDLIGSSGLSETATPGFEITLTYMFHGKDLIVNVDNSNIIEHGAFVINKVNVLPEFGSVKRGTKGYIFVPDGSGALIYNDTVTNGPDFYDIQFFGTDFSKEFENANEISPSAIFPVFGITDYNTGIFGIVEGNEGNSGVTAQLPNSIIDVNKVIPWFIYRQSDTVNTGDGSLVSSNRIYSRKVSDSNFRVRYHFLYGEKSTYTGMAEYYQKYLKQQQVINKVTENRNIPLDIEVIGAISKRDLRFGIPIERSIAISTSDDVMTFYESLIDQDINSVNILFTGTMNGGIEHKAPFRVNFENSIGRANGINSLNTAIGENSGELFISVDFARAYKRGNGLIPGRDLARHINKSFSILSAFNPSTGKKGDIVYSYLINPGSYINIINRFNKSYAKTRVECNNLYVQTLGSILTPNYTNRIEITRDDSLNISREALSLLSESGYNLKLDLGNSFALEFASSLRNVPVKSSDNRIIGDSIPFTGMVFKGFIEYTGEIINKGTDSRRNYLRTLENGAGLNYQLVAGDVRLLQNTKYTEFYSVSKEFWINDIIANYNDLNEFYFQTSTSTITNHIIEQKGLVRVSYSAGYEIIINFNDYSIETIDNIVVDSMDFKIVKNY